jgi:hypothetical protein
MKFLFVSLCASIGFETLFFWPGIGNAYTVPKVVAILLGAAVLVPQVFFRLLNDPLSRSRQLLLALLGFQILAVSWATANSMSPAVSFWGGDWRRMGWITQFAMMSAAMAVPLAIGSDFSRWKRLLQFIAAIGAVSAGYGVLQWIGWDPILPGFLRDRIVVEFAGVYRSSGTIGQPAYFANYLLYPFFAAFALLVSETGVRRILAGGAMTIIVFGIGSTGARNGLLGCAVGVGTYVVWAFLRQWRLSRRSIAMIAALLMAILLLESAGRGSIGHVVTHTAGRLPGVQFLESRLANAGTDSASIGRIVLWTDVFDRILPKVWLSGTGPGMFRVAYTRYRSDSYSQFDPDVHWENAHNLFLDRFTEQGIVGLLAMLALIAAFVSNIVFATHADEDRKRAAGHAAVGAGMAAVLVSCCFNGELIPTTFYFYLWIAISFACRDCTQRLVTSTSYIPNLKRQAPLQAKAILAASIAISIFLVWYAERNWRAETMLRAGEHAMNSGDWRGLLIAKEEGERLMPYVGTYHLEFAQLMVTFLGKPHVGLDGSSRKRLAEIGIVDARSAVERTDKPMLALQDMIVFADISADSRFEGWIEDLKHLDPYWFRPHEMSARLLLRQSKFDMALREVTIAHQLAPYVQSSTSLWEQLMLIRRESGATFR